MVMLKFQSLLGHAVGAAGSAVVRAIPKGSSASSGHSGSGAGAAGRAAHAPTSDDSMPVVEAFPLVEAEPTDGSEGAPTQEAPPAEEAPATEEAAPPAERRRRLLAMPKPGYSAHGHTQSLDGYMLVHVPDTAGAGQVFKAKTPSGHIWAFKVPETLPFNRIIKLHLPDLKAKTRGVFLKTPRHASLLHGRPLLKKGRMLDEAPPAEPAAVEVADLPEPEVEIVAPASDSMVSCLQHTATDCSTLQHTATHSC